MQQPDEWWTGSSRCWKGCCWCAAAATADAAAAAGLEEDHVLVDVPGMGSLIRARFVEKGVVVGGGGSIEGPEMGRKIHSQSLCLVKYCTVTLKRFRFTTVTNQLQMGIFGGIFSNDSRNMNELGKKRDP